MQNLPLTEDGLIRALREVPTPPPPPNLLSRLQAGPSRSIRWVWAVPATAATVLTVLLVVSLSLPSTLSLAQVAKVFDQHSQYRITNTRILGNGHRLKSIFYRDGSLWRSGNTFGLPDRTVSVASFPGRVNFVLVDERSEPRSAEFRVDRLLQPGATISHELRVPWHGRRVDRFTVHTTYRAGRTETFDQVVIADPKTKLPIQMTIMRDNASWGDVWDYEFGPPPAAAFQVSIPSGATVYDLREQRRQLPSQLASGPVGGLVIDEGRQIWVLTALNGSDMAHTQLRIDGHAQEVSGRLADAFELGVHPRIGASPRLGTLRIGGHDWHVVLIQHQMGDPPPLDPIWNMKHASGALSVGEVKIDFKSAPVIRTGNVRSLLGLFLLGAQH